jgi:hypothetical protein
MKRNLIGLIGMCFLSLTAAADDSVLSAACAARKDTIAIKHYGQGGPAALMTYTMKVQFPEGKKGFEMTSNWSQNISYSLNSEEEQITKLRTAKFFRFLGETPLVWLAAADPETTLQSLSNLAVYLDIVKRNQKQGQENQAEQEAALACAKERIKVYAKDVRRKYLQFRQVDVAQSAEAHID